MLGGAAAQGEQEPVRCPGNGRSPVRLAEAARENGPGNRPDRENDRKERVL